MSDEPTKYGTELSDEPKGADERPPPGPGDVIDGKYKVIRVLGQGGMGVVVAATHLALRQKVAIKFLLPRALKNKDAVVRFEREARAAVRLKSQHVARVLDTGKLETGAPYMVMEYLEGKNLSSLVRGSGGLPVDVAVDYVLQACEGVAEAHAQGIVHRDLKPANLFLTTGADGTPTVKVLDFGVSKVGPLTVGASDDPTADEGGVTLSDGLVGSPFYMSPEQMKSSRDVDRRTDVWAIGVCLFELLTGNVPFEADSVHQQYTLLMLADVPLARATREEVSEALDRVITRCLQRDRENRYADLGELALALAPFAPERSRGSIERIARIAAMKSTPTLPPIQSIPPAQPSRPSDNTWGTATAQATGSQRRGKSVRGVLMAGVLGVAGVSALAWVVWREQRSPATAPLTSSTPVATASVDPLTTTSLPPSTPPPSTSVAPPSSTSLLAAPLASAPKSARPLVSPRAQPTAAGPRGAVDAGAEAIDPVDLVHRK